MLKKFLGLSLCFLFLTNISALAQINKVAVIDLQKVVNNSSQVKALRKEQESKRKELAQFIKKASDEIKKEQDVAKKKALAQKFDKELKAKQDANTKAYKIKLEAIDKNISNTITQHAKNSGYDLVITKGVVLYGGNDITEEVSKLIK